MAFLDGLLMTVAITVIVLTLWPQPERRQTFHVVSDDGTKKAFSLPLGDPRLMRLKQRFKPMLVTLPPAELALAKWTSDLAGFYENSCISEDQQLVHHFSDDSSVVTASFDHGITVDRPQIAREATRGYWSDVKQRADVVVGQLEYKLQRSESARARFALGPIVDGQISTWAIAATTIVGLVISLILGAWKPAAGSASLTVRRLGLLAFTATAIACLLI